MSNKTVTIDLEDLKALVFSTGVIKNIEGALASFSRDPFVPSIEVLTDAHNRLASIMRNAERGELDTTVNFDEPLTDDELSQLQELSVMELISPQKRLKTPEIDQLLCKGMIELGTMVEGVLWSGEQMPALKADPSGFAVRITPRGTEALKERRAQLIAMVHAQVHAKNEA